MLKEYKVINNMREFRCLNIGQIRFYMDKHNEYKKLAKTNEDLNRKFGRK